MKPDTRRIACDRCRGLKARCVRPVAAGVPSPCRRCVKSGAECTTGLSYSQRHQPQPLSSPSSATRRDMGSSRIYESIPAPRGPIESIPTKRKMSPSFFEPEHSSSPAIGDQDGENLSHTSHEQPPDSLSESDPNPTALNFGVRLSPEVNHDGNDPFIDMPFSNPQVTTTTADRHGEEHLAGDKSDPESWPPWTKEDCLYCLSELSPQILLDSNTMRAMPLPDILSFSAWPYNSTDHLQPGPQNSIGRLLELS
ncbi:hypothetical protein BO78DRAFT_206518 [Aspergillus sclerotiicarbonarius CBS 121057]|uniref:Zn(2)-C6 fungal-type domain-containing protein n=1 Tax=Aspergillus sclerotiicarbonarius (strain CBS 121057 / IBT 28362) TaxID=1448318 RepID=A0A319DZC3_ASPSB|nr:hypothetical protein BO78DRAFT_206518 [Aspergillus sclerotiicarbonarius CBS 121057]